MRRRIPRLTARLFASGIWRLGFHFHQYRVEPWTFRWDDAR